MKTPSAWRPFAAVIFVGLTLTACATQPAFQVSEQAAPRLGTVVSINQDNVQNVNSAVGTVGGALVGGGLGSLVGGGRGNTVATVAGAAGGAFVGNQMAQNNTTTVWRINVRYDDGSTAEVQQTSPPNFAVGNRVSVSSAGITRIN